MRLLIHDFLLHKIHQKNLVQTRAFTVWISPAPSGYVIVNFVAIIK